MADTQKNGFSQVMHLFSREAVNERSCWVTTENYEPNRLLDALAAKMRMNNDAALASKLRMSEAVIKLLQEKKVSMTSPMLSALLNEATGITVQELDELLGSRNRGT